MNIRGFCLFLLFSCQMAWGLQSGDFTYELIAGGTEVEITDYPEAGTGAVAIPATIDSKPVTSIGTGAFLNCTSITSFTIPASVNNIEATAFRNCATATAIDVDAGNATFSSANGVLFNAPQTLLIQYPIGNAALNYDVPAGVTDIANSAFYNCPNLQTVSIPSSVTLITSLAFTSCHVLTDFTVDGANPNYSSLDGVLMNKAQNVLIQYPIGRTASTYYVPSTVVSIWQFAFYGCQHIEGVGIALNTNTIGQQAFNYCPNLKAILFKGNAPTSIGASAWAITHADIAANYLAGRTGFTTPAWQGLPTFELSYNTINSNTETQITDYPTTATGGVLIPDEIFGIPVTTLGYQAFALCQNVTDILMPEGLTTISNRAFKTCRAMTSIEIPASVTTITSFAFEYCTVLEEINVDSASSTYSSIDGVLLNKAQTTLVMYPIGHPRTQYTVPNSVTALENYAFIRALNLNEITLPPSLEAIGTYCFQYCNQLNGIHIPAPVTSIGNYAFEQCQGLQTLTFGGNNLTTIGTRAFSVCIGLISVDLPDSITSIGTWAFYNCDKMESIDLPSGLQVIERNTFENCRALKTVNLPTTLTTIGIEAFQYCVAYEGHLFLPATITSIGSSAFRSTAISSLDYQSPANIPNTAFTGCPNLEKVIIANGATSIGDSAFSVCQKLKYAIIPGSVTSIGSYAFNNCTELSGLFFHGNAPTGSTRTLYLPKAGFKSFYLTGSTGFESQYWQGFPAVEMGTSTEFYPAKWNLFHGRTYDQAITSADSSGDGISDLMAYALDLNPNDNNLKNMPTFEMDVSNLYLTMATPQADIAYVVESSTTLGSGSWTATGVTWSGPLTARKAEIALSGSRQFLRLSVSQNP